MTILIFFIVSYILLSISLYLLFPKAGVPAVKGLIPGVNFIEWAKIIGRKPTWALLLLIPIVNIFIFAGMCVDLVRSFGKLGLKHSAAAVFYPPAIFAKIAKSDTDSYNGPILKMESEYQEKINQARSAGNKHGLKKLLEDNPYKKSGGREWVESIFFAVFAAAFIRMFLIEAYVIPTPSMEGSLNVGDFLFVSKAHYGIRTPMTVAMFPLLHNRIPFIDKESYLESPSLPYKRLPALEKIEAGKPIVFNWPIGDSTYITPSRAYSVDQLKDQYKSIPADRKRNMSYTNFLSRVGANELITRPVDKKDHYIKRAVAVAGDSLQIIDGLIYVNGKPEKVPEHRQFKYEVTMPSNAVYSTKDLDKMGIDIGDSGMQYEVGERVKITKLFQLNNKDMLFLDDKQVEQMKEKFPDIQIERVKNEAEPYRVFPTNGKYFTDWTVDDFGPVYIPKAGDQIALTPQNLSLYRRLITVYEGNTLERKGNSFYVNGEEMKKYTVKQDYYWAMGDNRHNSEDSRAWGFVPHDHIVGKPLFIWFSTKEGNIRNGINWDRIFKSATVD